jgi:hypothetical protein
MMSFLNSEKALRKFLQPWEQRYPSVLDFHGIAVANSLIRMNLILLLWHRAGREARDDEGKHSDDDWRRCVGSAAIP